MADDAAFSSWALATAENRQARTINLRDEAADWLSQHLESELSNALVAPDFDAATELERRFVATVHRFGRYEQRLQDFDRRLEHEKLESLKELAYGASHEINNPLANIAARAQTLLDDEDDPERSRKLAAIHRQAMRAHEMISDLMLFARPPKLSRRLVDLRQILQKVCGEQSEQAESQGVELRCNTGDLPISADVDETQLCVAVQALIRNSLEAQPDGGLVEVTLSRITIEGRDAAEIRVRDNGPGISEAVRQHMFDPFFSGREAGRGLGFGLTKCWRIITDHGGQVVVNQPPTGGADIGILLPLHENL
jgi:signal transduction histidine kinase